MLCQHPGQDELAQELAHRPAAQGRQLLAHGGQRKAIGVAREGAIPAVGNPDLGQARGDSVGVGDAPERQRRHPGPIAVHHGLP